MKEQKFLIVDSEIQVNNWLDNGWKIVSVTPQHVSVAGDYSREVKGKFAVVIEKSKDF